MVGGELGSLDGESLELRFFPVDDLPSADLVTRFQDEAFEPHRHSAAFVWDDAWLSR